MKLGKAINHKIRIESSANQGFIVHVGCGKFVFADKKSLVSAMDEFLENPQKWEKEYYKLVPSEPPIQQSTERITAERPTLTAERPTLLESI